MKAIRLGIIALGLALLVAGSVSFALPPGDDTTHPRQLISSGATQASAGTVRLVASLGQPTIGTLTSGNRQTTLAQGFWHGEPTHYAIYLPLTVKSGS
mgnify:CR=1 FL=1